VLDGAVDRGDQPSQGLGDRLPDGRAEHGEDGTGDLAGVPANRLADGPLDRGRERPRELAVPGSAEGDCLGKQLSQLLPAETGCIQPLLELLEPAPLGPEEQLA
jgi:hypothetical protein